MANQIVTRTINITTTGVAGSASGSGTINRCEGLLLDIFINYHASCPATADVTISDAVFGNIVVKSNSNTDAWIAPRKDTCDVAAASTGMYDLIPLNGSLNVSIAQADALTDCIVVTIRFIKP